MINRRGAPQKGKYKNRKKRLSDFEGGFASEAEVAETIRRVYDKTGYVMDTHTAVAATVYDRYRNATGDETPTVIVSTASPFKFTRSVMEAVTGDVEGKLDFELIDQLSEIANVSIPNAIEEIRTAAVLHDTVCEKEDMKAQVKKFLGI